jgi:hypothetical protein
MAQLGERACILWNNAGSLASLDLDPEALRLRSWIEGIERCIVSKESELSSLRMDEPSSTKETGSRESDAGGPRPPQTEGTNGIS